MQPIVVHKKTKVPYKYLGNNEFQNLHTMQKGVVDEEKCKNVFYISQSLIEMTEKFPNIETLISECKLILG